MKALLICPAQRGNVAALAETVPLAILPILGKTLVEYWLEHLLTLGAREIIMLASDRPERVLEFTGNGARWGLRVTVHHETRELGPVEARATYRDAGEGNWLPAPHDVVLMDRLPHQPEWPLFASYAGWFTAVMDWLPRAATPDRIGVREVNPGVWMGLHTRVAASAELRAPCWLGENVFVGNDAVVGPMVAVEDRTFIEAGAKISESIIGPETFVGEFTGIQNSIAWGSLLVNWKRESCLNVPDPFLLCSLESPRSPFVRAFQPLTVERQQARWPWKFSVKMEP